MSLLKREDYNELIRLILDNFWYGSGDRLKFNRELVALAKIENDGYGYNRHVQLVDYISRSNIINLVLDLAFSQTQNKTTCNINSIEETLRESDYLN